MSCFGQRVCECMWVCEMETVCIKSSHLLRSAPRSGARHGCLLLSKYTPGALFQFSSGSIYFTCELSAGQFHHPPKIRSPPASLSQTMVWGPLTYHMQWYHITHTPFPRFWLSTGTKVWLRLCPLLSFLSYPSPFWNPLNWLPFWNLCYWWPISRPLDPSPCTASESWRGTRTIKNKRTMLY